MAAVSRDQRALLVKKNKTLRNPTSVDSEKRQTAALYSCKLRPRPSAHGDHACQIPIAEDACHNGCLLAPLDSAGTHSALAGPFPLSSLEKNCGHHRALSASEAPWADPSAAA